MSKRFIQNKSLEEDSFVISDGVIDRENDRIIRYDKEYCDLLNDIHQEKEYWKQKYKQEVEKHSIITAIIDKDGNWNIIPKDEDLND